MSSRGEVWLADLGVPTGAEQAYRRPVVVLQVDDLAHLNTVVVVPVTSRKPKHAGRVTNVLLSRGEAGLSEDSCVLCHHIRVLDKSKLLRKYGELSRERLGEIEVAVAFLLGLSI